MARKQPKTNSKKTAPRNNKRKTSKASIPEKPSSKRRGVNKESASAKPHSHSTPEKQAPVSRLSLERKIDLVGIVMAFIGLLTLLSLVSASQGSITGDLVEFLRHGFGWGMYFFPLGLLMIGIWLVLRTSERLPRISLERLIGIGLFFINLLA